MSAARRGDILDDPPAELVGRTPFWPVVVWGHPIPPAAAAPEPLPEYLDPEVMDETADGPNCADSTGNVTDPDYQEDVPEDGDEHLTLGLLYPEWNCRRGRYRHDWCRVYEGVPDVAFATPPDPELRRLANRVRRRFEAFRAQVRWRRRLMDGEEVDLDDFVTAASERRGTGCCLC